uniref:Transmembrane protein n=1 Tax=Ascaris lumbricoides TaxID=6252 RepID=A0A0M3I5T2_ASCLU
MMEEGRGRGGGGNRTKLYVASKIAQLWDSSNSWNMLLIVFVVVSLHVALIEYAYVMAHLLFYATMLFDFDGLELMTTTADVLFIDSCLDDVYEPNDLIAKRNGEIMMKRISAN